MTVKTLLCALLLTLAAPLFAGNGFGVKTVVIDAGHGGKDPGAIGPGKSYEKDAALAVAVALGEGIKKAHPDVNVVYTRKTDVFLELHERAEIANKNKADLFIAIHINSSTNSQVYGSSCYVLGLHKTEANLEVAKRENAVILLEDDRDKNYDFDPNTPEGHIIMSMKQNAFLDQSISMASKVEGYMENAAKRKSLGVKQAGFYVLYKTAMPSILAEIGFISNPDEEKFLKSEEGQNKIAGALLRAFTEYKTEMEQSEGEQYAYTESVKTQKAAQQQENNPAATAKAAQNVVSEPKKEEKPEPEKTPAKTTPAPEKADDNFVVLASGKKIRKPVESTSGGGRAPEKPAPPVVKEEPKPVPVKEEPKPAPVKTEPKPEPVKAEAKPEPVKAEPAKAETKPEPVKEQPKPATTTATAPDAAGVYFKVQLIALKSELKDRDKLTALFKVITSEELPNGITRYYGGKVSTYAQAKKLLETAQGNGFAGAFIVGYKGTQRLNSEEMKAYMQ